MKEYLVVSAVGKDRPGLVNRITHEISTIGGNIELQRSTRMAAEFAVIILFSLDTARLRADLAIERMQALRTDDLFVHARRALADESDRGPQATRAALTATGADQPGLIDQVTQLLFRHNINIESLDYDVDHAPMSGQPLFRLHARLAIPGNLDVPALRTSLRRLEDDLHFDVMLQHPLV